MNWSAIGAVAELIAAIGVILSLIYLALQIRNNTKMTRLAIRESYISGHNRLFERILENPDVYRIWRVGNEAKSTDEMSDEDRERFGLMLYSIFNQFHIAYEANQIDPTMGGVYLVQLERALEWPAVQSWWSRQQKYFDLPFADFVNQRINLEKSQ